MKKFDIKREQLKEAAELLNEIERLNSLFESEQDEEKEGEYHALLQKAIEEYNQKLRDCKYSYC